MKDKYHWDEEDVVIERAEGKKKPVQKFIEDMQATLNQKKIINKSHT
jgi:hypothetical protein